MERDRRGAGGAAAAGAAVAAATPALLELRKAVQAQEAAVRGLILRRAAERAVAAAAAAGGTPYEADADCCVCYEPLDRPHSVVTECGHVYHLACIEGAFASSTGQPALRVGHGGNCPICRRWVDRASLIKVNNGLPTRREVQICRPKEREAVAGVQDERGRGAVLVDLTADGEGDGCATQSPGGVRDGAARKERAPVRRNSVDPSADEAASALDAELGASLVRGRAITDKCDALVCMERALRREVEATKEVCDAATAGAAAARERAAEDLAKAKVGLRVQEVKVGQERSRLCDDRREAAAEIAAARKRSDELLIQIKLAEQAVADANEEKRRAEAAMVAQEERRERFARLTASYEAKRAAVGTDKAQVDSLERENRLLRKQVDALGKQVRRASKQPPPPLRGEVGGGGAAGCANAGAGWTPLADMEFIEGVVSDRAAGHRRGGGGDRRGAADEGDGVDDGVESDDDIVAAAARRYNLGAAVCRRPRPADRQASPPSDDRVRLAQGVFGQLQGPTSGAAVSAPIRPPPPPSLRRRPHRAGGVVGLAAFRPRGAPPPPKLGAIGASRAVPAAATAAAPKKLGVKRSFASPTRAPPRPTPAKRRNAKIDTFFQK